MGAKKTRVRSAKSGRFASKAHAKRNPDTTVVEDSNRLATKDQVHALLLGLRVMLLRATIAEVLKEMPATVDVIDVAEVRAMLRKAMKLTRGKC